MPAQVYYLYNDFALPEKGATIINAPSADVNFPVTNILVPDRKVLYKSGATPPDPVDIDIDLGGFPVAPFIFGAAAFNCRFLDPTLGNPDVGVYAGSSPGSIGTPAGTLLGTFGVTSNDSIVSFGGGAWSQRYWRFRVTTGGAPFQIGKVMLGAQIDSNVLGYLYSPESGFDWLEPTTDFVDGDGDPVQLITGKARRRYRHVYTEIIDSERVLFEAIAKETRPIGLIDAMGNHCQVVRRPPTPFTHQWGVNPGIWSLQLSLDQIP